MDNIQQLLKEMKCKVPDCTASRQRLKSILSDYIPTEKQKINSILNAYDEDVENRISGSSDKTLTALQFIKILKDDYGMTEDNAFWSIETWCYLLGYDEISEAIKNIYPQNAGNQQPPQTQKQPNNSAQSITLFHGIYLAGSDFVAGEIKLKVTTPLKKNEEIYYAILRKGSNSNEIITNGFFKSQVILNIKDGQRLQLNTNVEIELTNL
jgi:hypothetical protein